MSGRKIAFFDFDGTITTKDSLLEIIKFQKGKMAFYKGFLLHVPWLLGYKLKILPNDRVKEKILTYFFSGIPESVFQTNCNSFAETKLPSLIRPGALEEIEILKKKGFDVVVVSASAGNWIKKWTDSRSIILLATRLEVKNGIITGHIEGKNCHGEQKVLCIKDQWNLNDYDEIYAYGDSTGDKPMLALATKSFYKPFRFS